MIKTLVTYFFLSVFTFANTNIKSETEEFLKNYFGENIKTEFIKYTLPKELKQKIESKTGQQFFKDFLYIWKVYYNSNDSAIAILDNVYGKSQPITFLVILNKNSKIITVEIIKYREQYGGQISNKKWLSQFSGKDDDSSYKIGNDISSISGATISVNSITKGIQKIIATYNEIKDDL